MDLDAETGILGNVPGDFIALAMRALPKPAGGQPKQVSSQVDVLSIGHVRVRVRYMLTSSRAPLRQALFWYAHHAELIDGWPGNDG